MTVVERARIYATDAEVWDLVRAGHERTRAGERPWGGKRWQRNVGDHCVDQYAVLRKHHARAEPRDDGRHRISSWQIAKELFDVDPTDSQALDSRSNSVARWMKRLADAGLVRYETATDEYGRSVGWDYELLPVPERASPTELSRRDSGHVG